MTKIAIQSYPQFARLIRSAADSRPLGLARGAAITLAASGGVLAPDILRLEAGRPTVQQPEIPADGFLTFALDVAEDVYARATLLLSPDKDLRPGLRAYLLDNETLIAAPMVSGPEWSVKEVIEPLPPGSIGFRPKAKIDTNEWLLGKGRHYLTVAGPHLRPAGIFQGLEIRTVNRPVDPALYQFALITDAHIGGEPFAWMNMLGIPAGELSALLVSLRNEGTAFAVLAGDMTNEGKPDQIAALAELSRRAGLPVYGCFGNHDLFMSPYARENSLAGLAHFFPDGAADYAFYQPPLRFIVLDFGVADQPARRDWLRRTLEADRKTPTVVVQHVPFYNQGAVSACGLRMPDWSENNPAELLPILQAAGNFVASLAGHGHWDEVNRVGGTTFIQNAALAEWPHSYRVFRVYPDRLEWEVRQLANRGLLRASFLDEKAVSWMIAFDSRDLTGQIALNG